MATLSVPPTMRSPSAADLEAWIVKLDAEGIMVSDEGRLPGVNRQVSTGSSYYDVLPEICGGNRMLAAAVIAGIHSVGAGHAEAFSLEFPYQLPDREIRMRLAVAPAGAGLVVIAHTDADAIQESKMEALGRLAGGVAHDFANLITLISGYSDILLDRMSARDPNRGEIEEIQKAAARGAGTTANILDFVRRQAPPSTGAELNGLVAEMLTLLRPIVGEHITLEVLLDPNPVYVDASLAQMTRVVMNLVLNARDAMPHGGAIRIRTANTGRQEVTLEVSDSGTGMDSETLARVFEPFFTTKAQRGTGLGLPTVQRIVEQAGGRIGVRSQQGSGTSFTVRMPRAQQGTEITEPDAPARAAGGRETILLAEDEESVRKLLRHLLEADGYRVLDAVDGRDALRVFEQRGADIDLLLTDVIMPGMNGHDLAEKAMASKPGLKVIYISGYTDDVLSSSGALRPGVSFLRKPLRFETLTTRIREVLDMPVSNR